MTTTTSLALAHDGVCETGVPSSSRERDIELVAIYLTELSLASGDPTNVSRTGRRALDELMSQAVPRIEAMVAGALRKRFRHVVPDGLFDECVAQGCIAAMESVAKYDGRAPFSGWMVAGAGGPARLAMDHTIAQWTGTSEMKDSRRKMVARVSTMWDQLTIELGREPFIEELQDALLEQTLAYLDERRTGDELLLEGAELRAFLLRKASKKGQLAAIREVEDILEHVRSTTVSVDAWESGWDAIGPGLLASVETSTQEPDLGLGDMGRVALGGLTGDDRALVLDVLSGADVQDPARVAQLMPGVVERAGSPVAQFAFLSPTLALQFEDAPADRVAAARLAARHR